MATAYTTYSQNAQKVIMYQFTCEHCGKLHPPKSFTVTATASKNVNGKGGLHPVDSAMLQQQAAASLDGVIASRKAYVEKGRYGQDISGKCDFCGKRQSWEMKSAKLLPLWRALQGLAMGFLIMLFVSFFSNDAGNAFVICMPIGLVGGLIFGFVQLATLKAGTAKSAEKTRPTIYW